VLLLLAARPAAAEVTKEQCVDANERAQDLQHSSKLQEARAQLAICVSGGCPEPVREDCSRRMQDVERIQPTLVFDAKDPAGHDLADVAVTMDGKPLASRLDGRALPVDPGEHTFVFQMEGQAPLSQHLIVKEGEKERRERIVIGAAPPPEPVAPPAPAPAAPSSPGDGQRLAGIVASVAGVAALGVGAGFFAVATSKWSSAQSDCGSSTTCTSYESYKAALPDHDGASNAATISTIGVVAGAALLVSGAVIYFTAPPKRSPSTAATRVVPGAWPGGAGMVVWRSF
jgi:hypothetical protein